MADKNHIRPFKKLLAANRSEIAIRIFRAGTELNLRTVAIYAQADRFCLHRFKADEAYLVGEGKGPVAAYLDIESIVAVAKEKGVDAIHPGYGFLSENANFARACAAAGITFVGPRPELLDMMGDKTAARALAQKINVPVLPGNEEAISDRDEAMKAAKANRFSAHHQGRVWRRRTRHARRSKSCPTFRSLLDEAQSEAGRAFGNPAVFLEKYIPHAKHIEVQILGDQHGNVIHLHERDCSVQRRHQKVIEVAPSFGLPKRVVRELCEAAARMAREIRYDNAGTIEFLYDLDKHEWFFIEMNPRIQVEHTVTEVITGLDLVRAQILIAQGHELHGPVVGMPQQDEIPRNGYAIQCRVTTEDPENKFMPDYGQILAYRSPGGFGIRLDGGMGYGGAVITPFYDSLLVKLIASAHTYEDAMQRMHRALAEFRIRGVKTNIPFLENVIQHEQFHTGQATTTLIDTSPELFTFQAAPRPGDEAVELPRQHHRQRQSARQRFQAGEAAHARARRWRLITSSRRRRARATCCSSLGRKNSPSGRASKSNCSSPTPRCAMRISRSWPRACALTTCWPWRARWRTARRVCSRWKCGAARRSTPRCVF